MVTGQQVVVFGGPLLTLLKAATAVRLAKDATAAGKPTVPIFWMATEDHDFAEVNHITFPSRHALSRLALQNHPTSGAPVGGFVPGEAVNALLDEAAEFLGGSTIYDALRTWYAPGRSLAQSFGSFIAHVFAPWGLVVIDAASREAHRLGAKVLRDAIVYADELHAALELRGAELKHRGYHAQVMVGGQTSLLFLLDAETSARLPLRRSEGAWKAGAQVYTEAELLAILEERARTHQPQRIAAARLPGRHPADERLRGWSGGDRLLCPIAGVV